MLEAFRDPDRVRILSSVRRYLGKTTELHSGFGLTGSGRTYAAREGGRPASSGISNDRKSKADIVVGTTGRSGDAMVR